MAAARRAPGSNPAGDPVSRGGNPTGCGPLTCNRGNATGRKCSAAKARIRRLENSIF